MPAGIPNRRVHATRPAAVSGGPQAVERLITCGTLEALADSAAKIRIARRPLGPLYFGDPAWKGHRGAFPGTERTAAAAAPEPTGA
jgi:hypothetical protein